MSSRIKILLSALMLAAMGCTDEGGTVQYTQAIVQLQFSNDAAIDDVEGITITATNADKGIQYSGQTDAFGASEINVEPGKYTFSAQHKYSADNTVYIFNGSCDDVLLFGSSDNVVNVSIEMTQSTEAQIVFREIYYTGCTGSDGTRYLYDQYVILHNNWSDTAYLDSLCLAHLYPTRATSKSYFAENDFDYTVAFNFAWQFPGTGTDYPLAPGEDVVVAPNCIDHVALGNDNSVDLSKSGYWACYSNGANLTKQTSPATPEKLTLNLLWKQGSATSCISSCFDPAFVIWKIKGDVDEYLNNSICMDPSKSNSTMTFLQIPFDWIIDGVECFDATNRNKRLPSQIDNGYALNEASIGSGTSVVRIVDEEASAEAGFTVYQDTNDSSLDFVTSYPPTLKE